MELVLFIYGRIHAFEGSIIDLVFIKLILAHCFLHYPLFTEKKLLFLFIYLSLNWYPPLFAYFL